jgi:hypothetical protein
MTKRPKISAADLRRKQDAHRPRGRSLAERASNSTTKRRDKTDPLLKLPSYGASDDAE